MAQLSNDCFATGQRPMALDEALAIIRERLVCVTEPEQVRLAEADNRVLAAPAVAPISLPPFDNSAVDGYAVRHLDLRPGEDSRLPVIARTAAGEPAAPASAGGAVRIFTGAPMPAGLDTVVMQEDVRLDGSGHVLLPSGLPAGANRRLAGEDIAQGAVAVQAGRRLAPVDLALLSGLGFTEVHVRRRLRVAILSTGNEVAPPGASLGPGQLYDANRAMLVAMARRCGCDVGDLGILPDRREAVAQGLRDAARSHDLVLTSGGVSTGEEDHVRDALEQTGSLSFWRLGIKPGRPVAMGLVDGTPFMGLPGNPAAAFVTFALVAKPVLAQLAGEVYAHPIAVPVLAAFAYRKKEGRREYVRAKLRREEDGAVVADKHPREGAGIITSLTDTDGLLELTEQTTRLTPGDRVGFLPYAALY